MTHLGIRKDLQVQDEGKPRDMAPAVYVLDKVKRKEFCEVLSRVRCWKYALEAIINGYYYISLFMVIVYYSCYNCIVRKS